MVNLRRLKQISQQRERPTLRQMLLQLLLKLRRLKLML
jgi:hypothetical protein